MVGIYPHLADGEADAQSLARGHIGKSSPQMRPTSKSAHGTPHAHRGRWVRWVRDVGRHEQWGLQHAPRKPAARPWLPLTSPRPDYTSSVTRCELSREAWIFRGDTHISKHHMGQQPPHGSAPEVSDLSLPSHHSSRPQSQPEQTQGQHIYSGRATGAEKRLHLKPSQSRVLRRQCPAYLRIW